MGSAQKFTASLARFTVGRAVHVKIHPRPRNLKDSRDVLRALEQFGEVAVFKHLKYEPSAPAPNSAIAVYQQIESAKRAMDAKMVHFKFGQPERMEELGDSASSLIGGSATQIHESAMADGLRLRGEDEEHVSESIEPQTPYPSSTNRASDIQDGMDHDNEESYNTQSKLHSETSLEDLQSERPCTLVIRPSALSHSTYISRQGYYGPFPLEESTVPGKMLLGVVPRGLRGLYNFDLRKGEEQISVRRKRSIKQEEEIKARGWTTLGDLWEKGMREKEQA